MRAKTGISFLCLVFLLWGGCSKEEESLPPAKIVKVRKPIIYPQPGDSEGLIKQADLKPDQFEKKERERAAAFVPKTEGLLRAKEAERGGKGEPPSSRKPGDYGVPRRPEGEASPKPRGTQTAGVKIYKELKKIRFVTTPAGDEKVLMWLNGKFPPNTFSLEGERPRVVCDFMDTRLGENVGKSIKTGGRMIKEIRIGLYKGSEPKVRVVLDLVSRESGDYEVQPIFYQEKNIFALVVK